MDLDLVTYSPRLTDANTPARAGVKPGDSLEPGTYGYALTVGSSVLECRYIYDGRSLTAVYDVVADGLLDRDTSTPFAEVVDAAFGSSHIEILDADGLWYIDGPSISRPEFMRRTQRLHQHTHNTGDQYVGYFQQLPREQRRVR